MAPTNPPILITGASGLLGERLLARFRAGGWKVLGVGGSREVPGGGLLVDLRDARAVEALLAEVRPRAIVHGAAITNVAACQGDPAASWAVNVGGTGHLVGAAGRLGLDCRIVFLSTDLVFGGESAPYAEDAEPKPLNHYGSQKLEAERLVLAQPQGIVLRLPLLFGVPGRHGRSFLSWMVETLHRRESLALFEDEWRTPCWVEDAVLAVECLLQVPAYQAHGIHHAAGGTRVSRLEMGHLVCDAFGLDRRLLRGALRGDFSGGELRARDVSLLNERLASLGWRPHPLVDALARCAQDWPKLP